MTEKSYQEKCFDEYSKYLTELFSKAAKNGGFNFVCTILRVSGMELGHWDPYIEGDQALNDYSKLLRKSSGKRLYRLGLLIYCHAVEMSAPYDILLNLIRCINNKPYKFLPYYELIKKNKKDPFKWSMPYPMSKLEYLRDEAKLAGEERVCDIIKNFYSNDIRNAFYHSDYCLTKKEFRIAEGGSPEIIPLSDISKKFSECFAFYSAFAVVLKKFRLSFKKTRKIVKWPNYEVLEILVDEKEGLVGFKVHFSNDSFAHFERKKDKVFGQNFSIEDEGISLFQGCTDDLKQEWRMNGKRLTDKDFR